ncbi:hypothetical protein BX666DRAFT_2031768 [Dichotomocladium elegans]|nr:hypothetical protein BX666DRAFT_2031768 [Dichotomocladium elegans]
MSDTKYDRPEKAHPDNGTKISYEEIAIILDYLEGNQEGLATTLNKSVAKNMGGGKEYWPDPSIGHLAPNTQAIPGSTEDRQQHCHSCHDQSALFPVYSSLAERKQRDNLLGSGVRKDGAIEAGDLEITALRPLSAYCVPLLSNRPAEGWITTAEISHDPGFAELIILVFNDVFGLCFMDWLVEVQQAIQCRTWCEDVD